MTKTPTEEPRRLTSVSSVPPAGNPAVAETRRRANYGTRGVKGPRQILVRSGEKHSGALSRLGAEEAAEKMEKYCSLSDELDDALEKILFEGGGVKRTAKLHGENRKIPKGRILSRLASIGDEICIELEMKGIGTIIDNVSVDCPAVVNLRYCMENPEKMERAAEILQNAIKVVSEINEKTEKFGAMDEKLEEYDALVEMVLRMNETVSVLEGIRGIAVKVSMGKGTSLSRAEIMNWFRENIIGSMEEVYEGGVIVEINYHTPDTEEYLGQEVKVAEAMENAASVLAALQIMARKLHEEGQEPAPLVMVDFVKKAKQ